MGRPQEPGRAAAGLLSDDDWKRRLDEAMRAEHQDDLQHQADAAAEGPQDIDEGGWLPT